MVFDNVKRLSEEKNMTFAEIEKKAGLGNGTIGKWQHIKSPTITSLIKVADVLGVTINALLEQE